ncbi:hypothetical protein [Elizabethkingia anophelis]|uniref:hypothetical protein n=1 Tax=Elizabethkingia anophelis TaxID=1117645 RepID=UPI00136FC165|nr:hypothetical protein [Elizabethkingia anophelis]MYY43890.1 hypothetical protein [Elizabethkingia anophelis]
MKVHKKYTNSVGGLLIAATFLSITSCRSNDNEGILIRGGAASVKVNLMGTDFSSTSGNSSYQATLTSVSGVNDNSVQRHGALITPSMILEAELSPSSISS